VLIRTCGGERSTVIIPRSKLIPFFVILGLTLLTEYCLLLYEIRVFSHAPMPCSEVKTWPDWHKVWQQFSAWKHSYIFTRQGSNCSGCNLQIRNGQSPIIAGVVVDWLLKATSSVPIVVSPNFIDHFDGHLLKHCAFVLRMYLLTNLVLTLISYICLLLISYTQCMISRTSCR